MQVGLRIREDVASVVGGVFLSDVVITLEVGFVVDCMEGAGVATKEGFDAPCP